MDEAARELVLSESWQSKVLEAFVSWSLTARLKVRAPGAEPCDIDDDRDHGKEKPRSTNRLTLNPTRERGEEAWVTDESGRESRAN